ncbi:hypothetical protein KI387_009801, partial [Taxus chinensis]
MADWAAIPSVVYSQPQPSQFFKNDRIFGLSLAHRKRNLGLIESHLRSNPSLQPYYGQGHRHFFTIGISQRSRTEGLLRTSFYYSRRTCSLNVLAFGDLVGDHLCERKHGRWQNISGFALFLKEPCNFNSNFCGLANDLVGNFSTRKHSRGCRNSSGFQCFAALVDIGNVMTLEWTSAVDEVLLATTVVLAYMAGIVTPRSRISGIGQNDNTHLDNPSTDNTIFSRLDKEEVQSNADDVWNIVQTKLKAAVNLIGKHDSYEATFMERENPGTNNMISLQAIEKGPRLRLLWTTLDHLHKEIGKVPLSSKILDRDEWIRLLLDILNTSIGPVYARWLQTEHKLKGSVLSEEVVNMMPDNFKRNNLILLSIKNSGKEGLYADLLFITCFGSRRTGSCCSYDLLVKHAVHILEDLVIALADGIATLYLELISMDGSTSSEDELTNLVKLSYTSTRALERFRNEVALNRWLQDNFFSVVAIYEDRFNLWTFESVPIKTPLATKSYKHEWWKKMNYKKMVKEEPLEDVTITPVLLPVKRTNELRSLSGWRYYYSMFLEFFDIVGPLTRDLLNRLGRGISFLL